MGNRVATPKGQNRVNVDEDISLEWGGEFEADSDSTGSHIPISASPRTVKTVENTILNASPPIDESKESPKRRDLVEHRSMVESEIKRKIIDEEFEKQKDKEYE